MIWRALLFLGVLFVAGCERAPKSDPAAATKSFFDRLSVKQLDAAFSETAPVFQLRETSRDFIARARELGLDGCAVLKTENAKIDGSAARQTIGVRTSFGAQVPLVITLTRDRNVWRVLSVKLPMNIETGISENLFTRLGRGPEITSAQDSPMPDAPVAAAMAKETMLRFHDAIQQKSFEDFYDGVARAWQRELTLGMLARTFQGFVAQRTNLIAIKDLDAALKSPPHIDSDGLLTVAGSYPTHPHRIDFEIKYFYELPNWRPFGVTVRIIE